MGNLPKILVSLLVAAFISFFAIGFLLFFSIISIPFSWLAALFVGLAGFFFTVLQVIYVLYAFAEQILFPKKEGPSKKRAEYLIKQSKEAK